MTKGIRLKTGNGVVIAVGPYCLLVHWLVTLLHLFDPGIPGEWKIMICITKKVQKSSWSKPYSSSLLCTLGSIDPWGSKQEAKVSAWSYVRLSLSVRLSASVSPELHVQSLPKFVVQFTHGFGSICLWRRCDTLCTSGCIDVVMFAHNGRDKA